MRGTSYKSIKDYKNAIINYSVVLEKEPNNKTTLLNR
jgi:hypothetical protein